MDDQYIGAEEQTGGGYGDKISFRLIVLTHLERITKLTAVEWHGGYWQNKVRPTSQGNLTEKVYTPDSRAAFINAVDGLYDLAYPYFDSEMQEFDKQYSEEIKEAHDKVNSETEKEKLLLALRKEDLKLHRKLWRALGCFLKRQGYFSAKEFVD